jgi:2Fe-2S ferredoxin
MNSMPNPSVDDPSKVAVNFRLPDGRVVQARASSGISLMEAAMAAGIHGIVAECGGSLSCATCHVYVDPEWIDRLEEKGAFEDEMLEGTASPREEGSRLSCQIKLSENISGIMVTIPPTQY